MRFARAIAIAFLVPGMALAQQKPLTVVGGHIQQLPSGAALGLNPSSPASAALNLPAGTAPTAPNNGDIWATTSGIFARLNGATIGPLLGTDASGATSTGGTGSVARTLPQHFADRINPVDLGAVGDGVTESGPAALAAITAAQASAAPVAFPHTPAGYVINGTPPGFTLTSHGTTYPYPGIMLGKYEFGGNIFSGTMLGNAGAGKGTFNNQYTNPFNATSDVKWTFDPAALRNEASLSGYPQSIESFSLECAPNRPNPLNSNPNRNWIACMYAAADTGKGGGAGTSIATGIANWVLNVDENSGTGLEFDVDSNGTGTKDGGIVRGLLMAGSGNDGNNTSNYIGIDILRSSYTGAYQPYGAGISVHSSITNLELWKDVANEYGYFIQALDSTNGAAQLFVVDKNGYVSATGYRTLPSTFSSLAACSSANDGSQRAITDGPASPAWGQAISTGGGSQHMLLYCDGTNWTVAAK